MPKAKVTFQDIGVSVTVPAGTRLIEVSEKVAPSTRICGVSTSS